MVSLERLFPRSFVRLLSGELDMAGVKTTVSSLLMSSLLGIIFFIVVIPLALFYFNLNPILAFLAGLVLAAVYEILIYLYLELKIEQKKRFVESILPDYLQIVAANIRSGVSLDKAMTLSARKEFKFFSDDIGLMNKELYAGETLPNSLTHLANKYRSLQLRHTVRMMIEAIRYGGAMTDLLNQIARDLRTQQTMQKEISGQLFLYTIFIVFAVLIAAPVLYGLTTQMITVTTSIWSTILKQNPGGLPTTGVSFLKPSPPQINGSVYEDFAITALIIITAFGSFIVSIISRGSVAGGVRLLPIFVIVGLAIFFIVTHFVGGIFASLNTV